MTKARLCPYGPFKNKVCQSQDNDHYSSRNFFLFRQSVCLLVGNDVSSSIWVSVRIDGWIGRILTVVLSIALCLLFCFWDEKRADAGDSFPGLSSPYRNLGAVKSVYCLLFLLFSMWHIHHTITCELAVNTLETLTHQNTMHLYVYSDMH